MYIDGFVIWFHRLVRLISVPTHSLTVYCREATDNSYFLPNFEVSFLVWIMLRVSFQVWLRVTVSVSVMIIGCGIGLGSVLAMSFLSQGLVRPGLTASSRNIS